MKHQNIVRIAIIVGLILLVPLIAMQFTEEVNWSLTDFVVMGALLFGTGLGINFALNKLSNPEYRVIVVTIIVLIFLLIWVELAVGIFNTPFAGS
ncbi:MAG: hypothetical protein WCS88_02150 [Patescibacteria group bacterium]|jgi:hypothetical protein